MINSFLRGVCVRVLTFEGVVELIAARHVLVVVVFDLEHLLLCGGERLEEPVAGGGGGDWLAGGLGCDGGRSLSERGLWRGLWWCGRRNGRRCLRNSLLFGQNVLSF